MIERDPGSNAMGGMLAWFGSAAEAARLFRERGYHAASSRYATIAFAYPFAKPLNLRPAARTTIVQDVERTIPLLGRTRRRVIWPVRTASSSRIAKGERSTTTTPPFSGNRARSSSACP